MKTFTTHLQTMILMVLFAFATVQKANASAKAGEASVYEGSTVTIALADTYKRTLMQSTGCYLSVVFREQFVCHRDQFHSL